MSWFVLALTALAALLSTGLEPGGRSEPTSRALLVTDTHAGSPTATTDRRSDGRVPFIGAVLTAAPSAAAPPAEPATSGDTVALAAPLGVVEHDAERTAWSTAEALGGSGRAPPVTTGT